MTIAPGSEHTARVLRHILCCLVGLTFSPPAGAQEAAPITAPEPAPAIEMQNPRLSFAEVDWDAARAVLTALAPAEVAPSAPFDPLARLNLANEKLLPKISASPVPVLLPFDTAAALKADAQGTNGDPGRYLLTAQAVPFFFAGPSGYDAAISFRPQDAGGVDLTFEKRVGVHISGSVLLYDVDAPALAEEIPVPELDGDFPGIRRILLEEHLRYTFRRFGVSYVLSMLCFDGSNSARRLSCREADKIAVRILKALAVVGGSPQFVAGKSAPPTVARPEPTAPEFTFYAPGDILPGSGMKGQSGRNDATVYAKIRFPMAQAPDYVNSQSFMNWGDCDHTGRAGFDGDDKAASYRCRVNSVPLVHDESKNYAYPWRDNFCEHRYYRVGQCPAGLGHQGEDIRPASCVLRNEGADRCDPYQHDLVAVRDGVVMRNPGDEALYLVVDQPGEHIRFRYLHMSPAMLDAAGMVNGRALSEGEVIGAVSNYGRRPGGTSYHLHFDVQVLTRDGWVFVDPYMTLVASYERLIGGRGRVVRDPIVATASIAAPAADGQTVNSETAKIVAPSAIVPPSSIVAPEAGEPTREHKTASAENCKTRVVKGHRRRLCEPDRAERRERGRHGVRTVDRGVSDEGRGARHHRGDIHSRHARGSSRHGRA